MQKMNAELAVEVVGVNQLRAVRLSVERTDNAVSVFGGDQAGAADESDLGGGGDVIDAEKGFRIFLGHRLNVQMIPGRLDGDVQRFAAVQVGEADRMSL